MSTKAISTVAFEVELVVSGVCQPGCEAWGGSRFERPINPPEDDRIEDAEIIGINYSWPGLPETDILKGVNLQSPDVQRLLENIVEAAKSRIEQEMLDSVRCGS